MRLKGEASKMICPCRQNPAIHLDFSRGGKAEETLVEEEGRTGTGEDLFQSLKGGDSPETLKIIFLCERRRV